MPRPTAAQFVYGSATVVFSAFALLILTGTTSAPGIAAIGVASMALGLMVSVVQPMGRLVRTAYGTSRTAPAAAARTAAPREHAVAGARAIRR